MAYDIKIRGGTIIDGTGAPGYAGDVGIANGRIVALGEAKGDAKRTIDATGRVVAPGFIDIHTHYDAQIMWDPMLTISPWHGVTTVLLGNCGFGIAPTRPEHRRMIVKTLEKVEGMSVTALDAGLGDWSFETFPQYLDAIEKRGTAINVASYIGHSPLRLYVMGGEATERAATEAEIAEMCAIVREAMGAGALGFSTSESPNHVGYEGRPVPSRMAEFEEMRAIAAALGETRKKGVVQISAGGEIRFDHYCALAEASGQTINWSSLLTRKATPGLHREYMKKNDELIASGVPIYPQMSCRELNLEFRFEEPFPMERVPMFRRVSTGSIEDKKAVYADPEFRGAFKHEMSPEGSDAGPVVRLRPAWEATVISYCPDHPELEERGVFEVARERGTDPVDLAFDLAIESELQARFRIPLANNDSDGVAELLRNDHTLLGLSDAGAHTSQLCDACFSTHLLGHWVREKGALTLEQAIHKLTALPAGIFGLDGRGRLADGAPADVVVFDPETVAAGRLRRVADFPGGEERLVSDAIGIEAVIVNGALLREHGEDAIAPDGDLPGSLLRNGVG